MTKTVPQIQKKIELWTPILIKCMEIGMLITPGDYSSMDEYMNMYRDLIQERLNIHMPAAAAFAAACVIMLVANSPETVSLTNEHPTANQN